MTYPSWTLFDRGPGGTTAQLTPLIYPTTPLTRQRKEDTEICDRVALDSETVRKPGFVEQWCEVDVARIFVFRSGGR